MLSIKKKKKKTNLSIRSLIKTTINAIIK